jgi:hypothetical protein
VAGISVAGISVAGASVAAGGASVVAGAQEASIMEANTTRLTNDHNSDFLFILSPLKILMRSSSNSLIESES